MATDTSTQHCYFDANHPSMAPTLGDVDDMVLGTNLVSDGAMLSTHMHCIINLILGVLVWLHCLGNVSGAAMRTSPTSGGSSTHARRIVAMMLVILA